MELASTLVVTALLLYALYWVVRLAVVAALRSTLRDDQLRPRDQEPWPSRSARGSREEQL